MKRNPLHRQDLRAALGVSLAELGREMSPPCTGQYVGECIDHPDPRWGRRVKVAVARRLRTSVAALWPASEVV